MLQSRTHRQHQANLNCAFDSLSFIENENIVYTITGMLMKHSKFQNNDLLVARNKSMNRSYARTQRTHLLAMSHAYFIRNMLIKS